MSTHNRSATHRAALAAACATATAALALPEAQVLVPDDAADSQYFGSAVAIDGPYAIVGGAQSAGQTLSSGAVYVFDTSTWVQIHKLIPADPLGGGRFGQSIALDGTTAIIGAPGHDDDAVNTGTAYVFDIKSGTQLHELTHERTNHYSYEFGISVDLDGPYAVVGTQHNGLAGEDGAFLYSTATGDRLRALKPDDFAELSFTGPVAISGSTALASVTRAGVPSVLVFDAGTGAQRSELTPSTPGIARNFGAAIAIDGNTIVVGSNLSYSDGFALNDGVAYVFDADTGEQRYRIDPPLRQSGGFFGLDVAVDDTTILIGSDIAGGTIYALDAASGDPLATLRPEFGTGNWFGRAIAVCHGTALAGDIHSDAVGIDSGAAFGFDVPCSPADLALPVGTLDLADIVAFATAAVAADPAADLDGSGTIDLDDAERFMIAFTQPCSE